MVIGVSVRIAPVGAPPLLPPLAWPPWPPPPPCADARGTTSASKVPTRKISARSDLIRLGYILAPDGIIEVFELEPDMGHTRKVGGKFVLVGMMGFEQSWLNGRSSVRLTGYAAHRATRSTANAANPRKKLRIES